jgi:hypothetical protein
MTLRAVPPTPSLRAEGEAVQSGTSVFAALDCFAALAMTTWEGWARASMAGGVLRTKLLVLPQSISLYEA